MEYFLGISKFDRAGITAFVEAENQAEVYFDESFYTTNYLIKVSKADHDTAKEGLPIYHNGQARRVAQRKPKLTPTSIKFTEMEIEGAIISYESGCYKLTVDGKVWMTNSLDALLELETQVECAYGDVLVCGLGMGLITSLVLQKGNVHTVTVVEKDARVINLFKAQPFYDNSINIIHGDVYDHVGDYDVVLADHYNREDFSTDAAVFKEELEATVDRLNQTITFDIIDMYLWQDLTWPSYAHFKASRIGAKSYVTTESDYTALLSRYSSRSVLNANNLTASYIEALLEKAVNPAFSKSTLLQAFQAVEGAVATDTRLPYTGEAISYDYGVYRLGDDSILYLGVSWKKEGIWYSAKYEVASLTITDLYIIYANDVLFSAEIDIETHQHVAEYPANGDDKYDAVTGELLQVNEYIRYPDELDSVTQKALLDKGFPYINKVSYLAEKPYGTVVEFSVEGVVNAVSN